MDIPQQIKLPIVLPLLAIISKPSAHNTKLPTTPGPQRECRAIDALPGLPFPAHPQVFFIAGIVRTCLKDVRQSHKPGDKKIF